MGIRRYHLEDILLCVSNAVDLIAPELSPHHQQTACLAYYIARRMGLSPEKLRDILSAGMLHDIGALSRRERLELIEDEPDCVDSHSVYGARLLEKCAPLRHLTPMIRYHHTKWQKGANSDIPTGAAILYIADRACVALDSGKNVLAQSGLICSELLSKAGPVFSPEAAEALYSLRDVEHIWLELMCRNPLDCLPLDRIYGPAYLTVDDLEEIACMLSHVIDFRSSFTAVHSMSVAHTARKLGEICGFDRVTCRMMLISGYLHDIGKLAVPGSILEKPGKLDPHEFAIMRSHTFHTFRVLSCLRGFSQMNRWASYHHERLNGRGYPFHITARGLSIEARVMAVADVFTAITEPRPYRGGMDRDSAISVLRTMASGGSLDKRVVSLAAEHFDELYETVLSARDTAQELYGEYVVAETPASETAAAREEKNEAGLHGISRADAYPTHDCNRNRGD